MNQSEYMPALQWFVEYDLDKDLKANNKKFLGFFSRFTKHVLLGLPTSFFSNWRKQETKPLCSGPSNNVNLQRSTYARLKWDIYNLNMKNGQNKELKNQNAEFRVPLKRPRKGPRMNLPMEKTNFYVQKYGDTTWNTKLGEIRI